MAFKLGTGIGLVIIVSLIAFVIMKIAGSSSSRGYNLGRGSTSGASARLPCMANNTCPMGQNCVRGFCSENFMSPISLSTDMSSCGAKQCNGINAPCARSATPCGEGTFCQNNSCVSIAAPDQGQAYKQIGMLLQ